jgi:hypothetical protein
MISLQIVNMFSISFGLKAQLNSAQGNALGKEALGAQRPVRAA